MTLPYFLEEAYMKARRCENCGAVVNGDPSWRWNGSVWEHRCLNTLPQAGSFVAVLINPENQKDADQPGVG